MAAQDRSPPAKPPTGAEKTGRPHAHFVEPIEVVDDQALSRAQKSAALGSLEQDARQMAAASSEGMGGGEPTALRAVLTAQASLALPPTAAAYDTVRRDLKARRDAAPAGSAHAALFRALEALDAVAGLSQSAQDEADQAAAAEVADELRRERLDP
jgi:hypothetical protein